MFKDSNDTVAREPYTVSFNPAGDGGGPGSGKRARRRARGPGPRGQGAARSDRARDGSDVHAGDLRRRQVHRRLHRRRPARGPGPLPRRRCRP